MSAYSNSRTATMPGFGPGTHLMTTEGELPVEWLATGDRVITRDHGAQPILGIGRVRVPARVAALTPGLIPVEIEQGALGEGCPTHSTWLAPAHRVLLSGAMVELHAGVGEALTPIDTLMDGAHVRPAAPVDVCYTQVLLPMHDLVQANGLWAETLLLDAGALRAFQSDLPAALLAAPSLRRAHARAARLCLTGWEVRSMRGRQNQGAELIRHVA